MTELHELERGDRISIDSEPLAGPLWAVVDTKVKDLGIVELPIVTAVSDSETWVLTTGDEADFTASKVDTAEAYVMSEGAVERQS